MRARIIAFAMLLVSGLGPASAQPASRRPSAGPADSVVVELFTAQGCAECPRANALVEALGGRPGVIALTYAVDYWDYLGWPDTFARPAFAERQRAYLSNLGLRDAYTPQVIIDGRRQASGAQPAEVRSILDEEIGRRRFPPEVEFRESGDAVGIGSGPAPEGGADVWLIRYQPGAQLVQVREGENRGETVRHANVVRDITSLGEWSGRPVLLPIDAGSNALSLAVLVQSREDGHILAAAVR